MFDTHAVARTLTEAELTPAQADAITDAVRLAAEHDAAALDVETLATKSDLAAVEAALKTDVAAVKSDVAGLEARLKSDLRAEISAHETRLVKWMVGVGVGVAGLVVAALRLLGPGSAP